MEELTSCCVSGVEIREEESTSGPTYDKDLNPLWDYEMINTAWHGHGHALQFSDVDKDGKDELLAGGTLFDT